MGALLWEAPVGCGFDHQAHPEAATSAAVVAELSGGEYQCARRIRWALHFGFLVVRRGFGLVEGCSASLYFGDDVLCGFVPDEGFGVLVPVIGPGVDRFDELGDASEAVPA